MRVSDLYLVQYEYRDRRAGIGPWYSVSVPTRPLVYFCIHHKPIQSINWALWDTTHSSLSIKRFFSNLSSSVHLLFPTAHTQSITHYGIDYI
jgi:hypothetical protein